MGLDEDYFTSFLSKQDNNLRLLHYPPVPKSDFDSSNLNRRAGQHTDYVTDGLIQGFLTFLFQDSVGGLEVLNGERNEFEKATPIPGF